MPHYNHYKAVEKSGVVRYARNLDSWLTSPNTVVPGGMMDFRLPKPADGTAPGH